MKTIPLQNCPISAAIFAVISACTLSSQAQVIFNSDTASYSQNFNSLGTSNVAWADNSTLTGWYLFGTGDNTLPTVYANDGSSASAFFANYGTTSAADRSLGAITRGNRPSSTAWTGSAMVGLRINNNSGVIIDQLSFGYVGEQWRSAGTISLSVTMDYQIGSPANLNSGTWTSISGGGFTSPTNTNALALDGNIPANQVSLSSVALSGLSWNSGTDLWLRWTIPAAGSNQAQGLSVDNFSINAIPEPSTASMVLVVLGATYFFRRRIRN